MSGEQEPTPERSLFEISPFWYGVLALIVALCVIEYYGGVSWLPWPFNSPAPVADGQQAKPDQAKPEQGKPEQTKPEQDKSAPPPAAAAPAPQPGCSHGAGPCDWAGLHAARPACRFGVGACDWGKQTAQAQPSPPQPSPQPSPQPQPSPAPPPSPQPQRSAQLQPSSPQPCHYGIGACDWTPRISRPDRPRQPRIVPRTAGWVEEPWDDPDCEPVARYYRQTTRMIRTRRSAAAFASRAAAAWD
jgi:hypothetical protein